MRNRDKAILQRVLDEMEMARSLMGARTMGDFLDDEMAKRAICMTVINVGELVKNLDMEFRADHPSVPWKDIAGFRDLAAHKYQTLRMEDVYLTVIDEFPPVASEIQAILNGDA